MQNYEIIGKSKEWIEERDDWERCNESFDFVLNHPDGAGAWTLDSFVGDCIEVASVAHLGANYDPDVVLTCCERGVDIAIEYFFGDWMNHEDHRDCRTSADLSQPPVYNHEEGTWYDANRNGITLALMLGRDEDARTIAGWAIGDLTYDEGVQDHPQCDNDYHVVLASFVSGEENDRVVELEESIRGGRKPRPKLLLNVLDAVRQKDSAAYQSALVDYLKRYFKVELKKSMLIDYLALDGIILWHLADRAGLEQPPLLTKLRAVMTTAQDLKLPINWEERVGPTTPLSHADAMDA